MTIYMIYDTKRARYVFASAAFYHTLRGAKVARSRLISSPEAFNFSADDLDPENLIIIEFKLLEIGSLNLSKTRFELKEKKDKIKRFYKKKDKQVARNLMLYEQLIKEIEEKHKNDGP